MPHSTIFKLHRGSSQIGTDFVLLLNFDSMAVQNTID